MLKQVQALPLFPPDSVMTDQSKTAEELGDDAFKSGKYDESETLYNDAIEEAQHHSGFDTPRVANLYRKMASVLDAQKKNSTEFQVLAKIINNRPDPASCG